MHNPIENQIRERAYELWLANGCREGEADRHWLTAEREVLTTGLASMPSNGLDQTSAKRRAPTAPRRQAVRTRKAS